MNELGQAKQVFLMCDATSRNQYVSDLDVLLSFNSLITHSALVRAVQLSVHAQEQCCYYRRLRMSWLILPSLCNCSHREQGK